MDNENEELKKKADNKIKKEGWIRVSMMVEAMAVNAETAESAITKHAEKMSKEDNFMVYMKKTHETREVKKPLPNVEKGFSHVIEMEAAVENFDKLVYMVINYAPSSTEILEPDEIKMDVGEAQGVLNTLSAIIHRFAAMGAGGMLVST